MPSLLSSTNNTGRNRTFLRSSVSFDADTNKKYNANNTRTPIPVNAVTAPPPPPPSQNTPSPTTNTIPPKKNRRILRRQQTTRDIQDVDEDLLHRALVDAGRWAFGTVYAEVWIQSDDHLMLYCPEGGWWLDPVFHQGCDDVDCRACRLTNTENPHYEHPKPTVPGVELAGVLWSEVHEQNNSNQPQQQTSPFASLRRASVASDESFRIQQQHDRRRRRRQTPHNASSSSRHSISVYGNMDRRNNRRSSTATATSASEERQKMHVASSSSFVSPTTKTTYSSLRRHYGSIERDLGDVGDDHIDQDFEIPTTTTETNENNVYNDDHDDIEQANLAVEQASAEFEQTSNRQRNRSWGRRASSTIINSAKGLQDLILPTLFQQRQLVWRDMTAISNNPHLPYDLRTKELVQMGLGWAAGVSFNLGTTQGLVIYMARTTVDQVKLKSPNNEKYLKAATDLIGSAWAMRGPRQQSEKERRVEMNAALRRAKRKIQAIVWIAGDRVDWAKHIDTQEYLHGVDVDDVGKEGDGSKAFLEKLSSSIKETAAAVQQKVALAAKKCKGAGRTPPPPFSNNQSMFTAVGSAATLFCVTSLSYIMQTRFGKDYAMTLPPFGALVALQFGLTAAPAAQPKTAILGQILSLAIALSVAEIPHLPPWARQTLATSLSIGLMARCGVIHPPAGAAALAFSTGHLNWTNALMLMVGNVVAILLSAALNNLSEKRQYPTYWGVENWWFFHSKEEKMSVKREKQKPKTKWEEMQHRSKHLLPHHWRC